MEIVLFPSSVKPVGVAVHVLNLARLLRDAGLPAAVLCPEDGWLVRELRREDLQHRLLRIPLQRLDYLRSSLAVYRFLRDEKRLRIVHLHGRFPVLISLLSMVTLRRLEFVVTAHQFFVPALGGIGRLKDAAEMLALKFLVKRICCVSDALYSDLIRRLGKRRAGKVVVIRNWIRPIEWRTADARSPMGFEAEASTARCPASNCRGGRTASLQGEELLDRSKKKEEVVVLRSHPARATGPSCTEASAVSSVAQSRGMSTRPARADGAAGKRVRIVGVGRLSIVKGFDVLVDAVRILVEKNCMVTCDIYGDGAERRRLAAQVNQCGVADVVRLRGVCERVRYLLPEYDVLVVPSRREAFGLVGLEAYEAGIPVVASCIPGLSEVVRDRETGLMFPPGDAEALAQCITTLMETPQLRESLVLAGAEFVRAFYPNERLVMDYMEFYGVPRSAP